MSDMPPVRDGEPPPETSPTLRRMTTWLEAHGIECWPPRYDAPAVATGAASARPSRDLDPADAQRLRDDMRYEALQDIRRFSEARDNLLHARVLAGYRDRVDAATDDLDHDDCQPVRLHAFAYVRRLGLSADWTTLVWQEFPGRPPSEDEILAYNHSRTDDPARSQQALVRQLHAWLTDHGYAPKLFEDILLRGLAGVVIKPDLEPGERRLAASTLISVLAARPDGQVWPDLVDQFFPPE